EGVEVAFITLVRTSVWTSVMNATSTPSARHPWTSATEEGSADVGVYEEVEQDHYGNDHTEDNIQGRGGGMREFKCMPHQTDELNDHSQPESPALERPQPDGEDQGE